MKKRKKIVIICTIIITTIILLFIPFWNKDKIIEENDKLDLIHYCPKNIERNWQTSTLGVEVCGSNNKIYGSPDDACYDGLKYYILGPCKETSKEITKTSIIQIIIDKFND